MNHSFLFIVLAVVALYGLVEAWPILSGPQLSVVAPFDGEVEPNGIVIIKGFVARAVSLSLDGNPLLPNQNGSFSSTLAFASGTSILTMTATDRFGRSVSTTRTVFVP